MGISANQKNEMLRARLKIRSHLDKPLPCLIALAFFMPQLTDVGRFYRSRWLHPNSLIWSEGDVQTSS
jgi:hypothetical protein